MLSHPEFKIPIILLSAALLIILRAWLQSEKANAWYLNELYKAPRIKSRFPKPSSLRKFLLALFNLNHHQ